MLHLLISYSVSCLTLSVSVSLCVCLSVSLSVCVSVCLSVSLCVCLSLSVSLCLSVCLPVCLSVCLSLCLSVCLFPAVWPVGLHLLSRWSCVPGGICDEGRGEQQVSFSITSTESLKIKMADMMAPKVKPNGHHHPLVSGCSRGHKPSTLFWYWCNPWLGTLTACQFVPVR